MSSREILLFRPAPDAVYGFADATLIARVDSPYQRIEVWQTPRLGRLFTLDGRPMTSVGDEFIYHESMVHPVALAHPAPHSEPRTALVLGGGDGGAARELLKHPSIERIVVAELDAEVVRLTREHLPEVHGGAFDNPRVQLVIGDAADYVAHAPAAAFDFVVFDLTPPDSPAAGLYTREFLLKLKQVLRPTSAVSVHLGSPDFHAERVAGLLHELRAAFRIVRTMAAFIPLYGSLWMMATASDSLDPALMSAEVVAEKLAARGIGTLRHYAPDTHVGLFSTSLLMRDKLSQFLMP